MISVSIIRQLRLLSWSAESTQTKQAAAGVSQSNRSRVRGPSRQPALRRELLRHVGIVAGGSEGADVGAAGAVRKPMTHEDRDLSFTGQS